MPRLNGTRREVLAKIPSSPKILGATKDLLKSLGRWVPEVLGVFRVSRVGFAGLLGFLKVSKVPKFPKGPQGP